MRAWALLVLVVAACDPPERDGQPDAPVTPCTDMQCVCTQAGKPPTTISGTVFAPNGELPLYGATVYIPREDPGPLASGVTCGKCTVDLPGGFVVQTSSDDAGKFSLNVEPGTNVPLVIQIGKWRRQLEVLEVLPCQDNPIPAEVTRLPRNPTEGDMPKIAIVTGQFDALECLVRKLGIDLDQFTSSAQPGQVHLYASNGAARSVTDPNSFAAATSLWADPARLAQYDIALFSCEGEQLADQKTQAMMDNLKAYADLGGRVFLSHFHSIWISGEAGNPSHAPAVWPEIATCDQFDAISGSAIIDQAGTPKGPAFADWMLNVGGASATGVIPIAEGRASCSSLDTTRAERWVVANRNGQVLPQIFQFTTPNEIEEKERCGKVVFSDMHVASGSTSGAGTPFPNGCSTGPLTPQEKALAFMFFDISSCVGLF